MPTPSACASRAMPRRAPMSGSRWSDRRAVLMNAPRRPDGPPVRNGLPYSALVASRRGREAVRRAGARAARARLLGAGNPCGRSRCRAAGDRGLGELFRGRRRTAAADRGALYRGAGCAGRPAPGNAARGAPGRPAHRAQARPLRPRRSHDRGRAPARLVSAASRKRRVGRRRGPNSPSYGARPCRSARHAAPPGCCATITRPTSCGSRTRTGHARVGVLDFQDAVIGPAAYDVVSRFCRTPASTCRSRSRSA